MTLTIPDDLLKSTGMTERELLIEAACRLFGAGKLTLRQAGRMAGLERGEMEGALLDRNIPIYTLTVEEFRQEMAAAKAMGL